MENNNYKVTEERRHADFAQATAKPGRFKGFLKLAVFITVVALFSAWVHSLEVQGSVGASDIASSVTVSTPLATSYNDDEHVDMLFDAMNSSQVAGGFITQFAVEHQHRQYDYTGMLPGQARFVLVAYDGYIYMRYGTGTDGWSDFSSVDVAVFDHSGVMTSSSLVISSAGAAEWYPAELPIADTAALLIVGLHADTGETYANAYLNVDGYYTELPTMEEFIASPPPTDPELPPELPADPVKEGYTFTGWYMNEACTVPYDGREITENTTLYAGWAINRYTVSFDLAGGMGTAPAQVVDWNTAPTLPTVTREGYTFTGWQLNGSAYSGTGIRANATLVATWALNRYTVTLDTAGGDALASLTVDWNTTPAVPTPTRSGYRFLGWQLGGSAYTPAPVTSALTLTATWERIEYSVTLDTAGGDALAPLTVDFNTVPELPIPVRVGYDFRGWLLNGAAYVPAVLADDITLTASWAIKRFTVTFIVDGAEYRKLEVDYGTSLDELKKESNLSGYSLYSIEGVRLASGALAENNGVFVALLAEAEPTDETPEGGEKPGDETPKDEKPATSAGNLSEHELDILERIKANWVYIVCGVGVTALVVVGIVIGVFVKKRRG